MEVCRQSGHLNEYCRNRASSASSSKSLDGNTDNVSPWCASFLHERLVYYLFGCAMKEDVLLLAVPQDLHTRHGLTFMQGA